MAVGQRIFRRPLMGRNYGGLLLLCAGWFLGPPLYHLITHTPWMVRDPHAPGDHVATPIDFLPPLVTGLIFLGLGGAAIVLYINSTIEVDIDGLKAKDILGKVVFATSWSEIDRASLFHSRYGRRYTIYRGEEKTTFDENWRGAAGLVEMCKQNAPQVDFTDWNVASRANQLRYY